MCEEIIKEFIASQGLPSEYRATIEQWYLPFIDNLNVLLPGFAKPFVLGINGAQGTGKTTLAKFIRHVLTQRDLVVANLSLDDFYLSKAKRQQLADSVHPLLATRGVPGTHDIAQALRVFQSLSDINSTSLPRFDKLHDDCLPQASWPKLSGPVDVIILEGWCLGLFSQQLKQLSPALNALEEKEDPQLIWRKYVNQQLQTPYQDLFAKIDYLLVLKAPNFESVLKWRSLQESKLPHTHPDQLMNKAQLQRFLQFFERLTRHGFNTLDSHANLVFNLDENHGISSATHSNANLH
ncbi:MAG: hypothetical protein COC19_03610 [SAR86 cluster bacterium]|uniref:Phosphoribulokinase/uridine kinase domain-containing protein n=1 Tax=SAR86 cluster bacterium TaxID=2030880 RepID=A0A2A4MPY4_9GAMM|nr:MAG: hypothetical protein COC19_03610 [SAR86 cluster bacterium]